MKYTRVHEVDGGLTENKSVIFGTHPAHEAAGGIDTRSEGGVSGLRRASTGFGCILDGDA